MHLRNRTHLFVAALAAIAAACGGGQNRTGTGTMSVHLVDGPTPEYQQVNLHVVSVSIHSEADGWVTLGTPDKTIDLLTLTGGVAETLADGASLPAGHYDQLRLLLGPGNTVVTSDGVPHDLKVPSGMQSGLKLNVSFDVAPGTTKDVFIDFDAHRSVFVHQAGKSGQYLLRPVVFCVDRIVTGSISGTLTDDAETPSPLPGVEVTAQTVSASGPAIVRTVTTDAAGHYALDLLPIGGTYYVVAQPVVGAAVYDAQTSAPATLTDAAPTAARDLAFGVAAATGSLTGTISPPLGDNESDLVSLLQALPVPGTVDTATLVVGLAPGALVSGVESYDFAALPAAAYQAVVTRQGEDASGLPTFVSSAPVPVTVAAGVNTLDLIAP